MYTDCTMAFIPFSSSKIKATIVNGIKINSPLLMRTDYRVFVIQYQSEIVIWIVVRSSGSGAQVFHAQMISQISDTDSVICYSGENHIKQFMNILHSSTRYKSALNEWITVPDFITSPRASASMIVNLEYELLFVFIVLSDHSISIENTELKGICCDSAKTY